MVLCTPDWGSTGEHAYWRRVLQRVTVKRYPEPHDHGGIYNRSPCACYHLPFAGILLFHANLPRTAFGRRFGNLTLTTDVGRTCLCVRSGHFRYQRPHRQPMRCPLRFTHQIIRNQQGFIFILFP